MRIATHQRRTAVAVLALAASVLALAAAPAAFGHDGGPGDGDHPADPLRAAFHDELLERELALLPRETATGRCLSTREVAGLGRACRSADGLFRLELASGATVLTHGGDAPAAGAHVAAMPHLPATQDAIDGASSADVACTTGPGDPRLELVYAYPAGRPDRSATVAGPLRQAIYQASAFVDAEAQALAADAGRRIRVLCDGSGEAVVHVVQLDAPSVAGAEYDDVVDQLVARGFPSPTALSTSPRRFAIFHDDEHAGGAAGVASFWYDDTAAPTNLNNRGGRYAVEFDWSQSRLPHWDVLLHEVSHNMGAVLDGAPDSSGGGHCNDGLDVMCYADGGATSAYVGSTCAAERYDCDGDSYFHPSPPAGSWLATHWNVGSTANAFLMPRSTGWDDGGVPDTVAPSAPAGISVVQRTSSRIDVAWGAATDDRSTVRYRLELDRLVDGTWARHETRPYVEGRTQSFVNLASGPTWRIRVAAFDQAGNLGAAVEVQASTLVVPPTAPPTLGLTVVDGTTIAAAWPAVTSAAGIRGYDLELQQVGEASVHVARTASLGWAFSGLEPGATYRARVRSVDGSGVESAWRYSLDAALPGRLAGGDGALATPVVIVHSVTASTAQVAWTASPGAASWRIRLVDADGGATVRAATGTTIRLAGMRPSTGYEVQVTAIGSDSTASAAGVVSLRTTADTRAPGMVRPATAPRRAGATVTFRWRAAADDVGVARYVVQRRLGRRWVRIAPRGRSASVRRVPAHARVVLRVRAVDAAGNAGRWTTLVAPPVRRR